MLFCFIIADQNKPLLKEVEIFKKDGNSGKSSKFISKLDSKLTFGNFFVCFCFRIPFLTVTSQPLNKNLLFFWKL